jgi:hypothetical protein
MLGHFWSPEVETLQPFSVVCKRLRITPMKSTPLWGFVQGKKDMFWPILMNELKLPVHAVAQIIMPCETGRP